MTHTQLFRVLVVLAEPTPCCTCSLQYASNAAAAEHLEKQTNETIPYDGFDWIELRVDSSTKQGAGEWGGMCLASGAAAASACAVCMPAWTMGCTTPAHT
jgi:hypothetical protein